VSRCEFSSGRSTDAAGGDFDQQLAAADLRDGHGFDAHVIDAAIDYGRMVAGITFSICGSALVVWVAIALACGPSFIQKIEQRLRNVARCLLTSFAHPHECGPVPWTENGKNHEPG